MNPIIKIISLSFIIISWFVGLLSAQITKEEYRAQLEAYQKASNEGLPVFFDKSQPADKRIAAIKNIEIFQDKDQIKRCLDIVKDGSQPDAVRAAAIFKVRHHIHHKDELRNQALQWVEKSYTPSKLRQASMDVMQMFVFKTQTPEDKRQEALDIFRRVARTDSQAKFRERAMYVLTNYGDPEARRILGNGLRNPSEAVIAPDKAINLLAGIIDDSEYYYTLIQNVLNNPPSEAAQIEAIRALGNYAPARDDILKVLESKSASTSSRVTALTSLNASIGDSFFDLVEPVILDENAPEELRVRGLQAQMYRELEWEIKSPSILPAPSPAFDKVIEKVKDSPSENVRKAARQCAKKLRKEDN